MTFAFYRKWELWMFFITWKQSQIVSKVNKRLKGSNMVMEKGYVLVMLCLLAR